MKNIPLTKVNEMILEAAQNPASANWNELCYLMTQRTKKDYNNERMGDSILAMKGANPPAVLLNLMLIDLRISCPASYLSVFEGIFSNFSDSQNAYIARNLSQSRPVHQEIRKSYKRKYGE